MEQVHVNIINYLDKIANLNEILPNELAVVGKWKEQGILEHLFIKGDRTGAVLIFKNVNESKVKELLPTLPLHKFFDKVEYSVVDKQF